MRLHGVELLEVHLPVVDPIVTAAGGEEVRIVLLVRADLGETVGWGECVAFHLPYYSSEYIEAAAEVLHRHLVPALANAQEPLTPERVPALLAPVHGHRMAKAALECAVLDAWLRAHDRSLAGWLGGTRAAVDCGVSIGFQDTVERLVETVGGYLDAGYRRIKLKVGPGWDVEPVAAVRAAFGDDIPLQVDANCAYHPGDPDHAKALTALDAYGLQLIEQPFGAELLLAHGDLASRIETPICLDESITSVATLETALAVGACTIVNVKLGRVGGIIAARAIHDRCEEAGIPVWCGGMLESGVGRAANVALASLPNFRLPGDISESRRYFAEDITTPFTMEDGRIAVPTGPGIGVWPDPELLDRLAVKRTTVAV